MPEVDAPRPDSPIAGHWDPAFAPVVDGFRENFRTDGDLGAAACVMLQGRVVLDLWGGYRDAACQHPWQADTLVNAYSVGKGVLAILALDALARAEVQLDTPVHLLWPEFAGQGKDQISLRLLLSHQAGLPAIRPMQPAGTQYDWARMCSLLAAETPFWTPGQGHGYHANHYGYLVGEVLRRATGLPPGALLRERLTGPLQLDYGWGMTNQEAPRIAEVVLTHQISIELQQEQAQMLLALEQTRDGVVDHAGMVWRGYFNPPGMSGYGSVNTPAWRQAVIPSANGHGTARAIAGIYNHVLHGNWLPTEILAEATRIQADGQDLVLERPSRFGLGFQLPQPKRPIGKSPHAFGHFGHGGSLGFADPDAGLAFAYVTNKPGQRFLASRANRLLDALYQVLG